jgi:NAD(P)-dependent dehydrogenase (short-subunit alcohol dehydrogenase family)
VVLMSGNSAVFPKAPYAAVGTINAAIITLAKAFSDRGIEDGVQVNSVLPGPVMTGRRRSYLEHWAPLHNMTVEEATARFPKEAGIARYGTPEEIAELMAFLVSPGARWMTGSTLRMDGGEVKSIKRKECGDVFEGCERRARPRRLGRRIKLGAGYCATRGRQHQGGRGAVAADIVPR